GHIAPQADRDLFLSDLSLMLTEQDAHFELIGTGLAVYENFVFGARIGTVTNAPANVACGVTYRWIDDRNFDLVYVDTGGGFGMTQTRDGDLMRNVYDLDAMVDTEQQVNYLLIIAQDDRVTLYINGALVTQETVLPGSGRVGIGLLNYEAVRTDCFWTNIWVWPLE
ncbi:MAG: hypothetical protein JXA10_18820, partial [Anaerolineae bacterium]|nr:hypothetical protein [Anaerolineae bacterium]